MGALFTTDRGPTSYPDGHCKGDNNTIHDHEVMEQPAEQCRQRRDHWLRHDVEQLDNLSSGRDTVDAARERKSVPWWNDLGQDLLVSIRQTVFCHIRKRYRRGVDAEDYVQEAFAKLFNEPRRPDNIPGWLIRVARNQIISDWRSYRKCGSYLRPEQLDPEEFQLPPHPSSGWEERVVLVLDCQTEVARIGDTDLRRVLELERDGHTTACSVESLLGVGLSNEV
jgi:Sigma-70 region 2